MFNMLILKIEEFYHGKAAYARKIRLTVQVGGADKYGKSLVPGLSSLQVFSPFDPGPDEKCQDEVGNPRHPCGDQRCPHVALPSVDKRSINKAGPNDNHA
jgi:hypothetical protein